MASTYVYPARAEPQLAGFAPLADRPAARYGLPREVAFCRSCVISNQRPNSTVEYTHTTKSRKETIAFDDQGVCDACRVAERKHSIDWAARRRELEELCARFRREDGGYDCIVPGSGGKDSFYAAWHLKHEFGMHPLTVTWAPHMYTDWGWHNLQSWIHAGFDNVLTTPNGKVHRLLTRLAVENLFHPFQPFIIGQKALAPKLAALYDVPLVFYGENEAEYGNPIDEFELARRDWAYYTSEDRDSVFLGGTSVAELIDRFGLEEAELQPYLPADPLALERAGVEVHYLGYYLRWHPQGAYYFAVEHGDFQAAPERTPGTYSKYNSIDDRIDDFHYYTTHVKFGIGRATYDASQEIRSGDITRDEGVALVRRFDAEFPHRFADDFYRYLTIAPDDFPVASRAFEQPVVDRDYFDDLADRFRSPHLWQLADAEWSLRHTVWEE
jgi:N-acetyl sugar amidotransferase